MNVRPVVSIIIVSWNVREALKKNLERLFSLSTEMPFEVIVIDNGSHDKTPAMLRTEFPQVECIQNDSNRGFAFACNQGIKRARGNIFVLFNPDMLMGEGAIDHVHQLLSSRKEIGVMGVRLLRSDGSTVQSVRRDPSISDQLAILLKLPHIFSRITDKYLAKEFDYDTSQVVDQVRGSFFAFRRDVMDNVGLLDERFFIWFEEVDFCKRVREAGYKIWYSSDVSCTDLVGQSFRQQSLTLKQARFSNSMARYFFKWHPWWQGSLICFIRPWVLLFSLFVDMYRRICRKK